MADTARLGAARHLALRLDQIFSSAWATKPHLAIQPVGADEVRLAVASEPVETTLRRLDGVTGSAAAAVTALGYATRDRRSRKAQKRVRLTIAVTCCEVFAIIRSFDGASDAIEVDGNLIVLLREWAGLSHCSCAGA